jgi:sialic acid synthase SpsE
MQAEGMTLCAAAEELRVSAMNLLKWASQVLDEIDCLDKILRSKKKAALTGPVSQLKAIEDAALYLQAP